MKNLLAAACLLLLTVGCATSDVRDGEPAFSSLLDDESCALLYSMVEACHALGVTDPGEESCDEFSQEVRGMFAEILEDESSLVFIEEYCTVQCANGINGEKAPESSHVCL